MVLPKQILLKIIEELISLMTILMLQDRSCNDEVDDVCISGGVDQDGKEMVVGKCVTDVSSSQNVETG